MRGLVPAISRLKSLHEGTDRKELVLRTVYSKRVGEQVTGTCPKNSTSAYDGTNLSPRLVVGTSPFVCAGL